MEKHYPLLRFEGALTTDMRVVEWFGWQSEGLSRLAADWFKVMREAGPNVLEVLHDGCPVACVEDAPFAYVNAFKAHVNVGFFHGASFPDPAHLLLGQGKYMRHARIEPGKEFNAKPLEALIRIAYKDINERLKWHAKLKGSGT
jgi:hypothetical protein